MYIICEPRAGLCNRLGAIMNAKFLESQYEYVDYTALFWKANRSCGSTYGKLFERPTFSEIYDSVLTETLQKKILTYERGAIGLFGIRISAYIYPKNKGFLDTVNLFMPTYELRTIINKYIKTYKLSKDVMGIHVRSYELRSEDGYEVAINLFKKRKEKIHRKIESTLKKNPNKRILIISDVEKIEQSFKEKYADNVIIRPKISHVYSTQKGKINLANMVRDEEQIKEAVIDLFLMAKTSFFHITQSGTYTDMCKTLSEHYKWEGW